jgi:uncharacterized protein YjbI with pentapeptide repeats
MRLRAMKDAGLVAGAMLASLVLFATDRLALAADLTAREVTEALVRARSGSPADFSGKDLRFLDLAGLDFGGARLAHAALFGVDLTDANLRGADLSGARLDRAIIIRTDFSGANLTGAIMLRPTVYTTLAADWSDAPKFTEADMRGFRAMAQLDGADFRGADLTGANFTPFEYRPGQGTISTLARNLLKGCNFTGAVMKDADFSWALFTFAKLVNADLSGAKLVKADLSKADRRGANLTGADLTGADLDGANLTGVRGLDSVKGLSFVLNLDKTIQ